MPASPASHDVLNRDFLQLRARLLEVAAHLDRIDRAAGSVDDDPRMGRVRQALAMLTGPGPRRAEQVQLVFSHPYEPQWKSKLQMPRR